MIFLALLGAVLVTIAALRRPRARRGVGGALRAAGPYVAVLGAAAVAAWGWYFHRPQPRPRTEALFRGVTYERVVRAEPPMVAHVVRIDLREPSISFVVTPHEPGGRGVRGATTSEFLRAQGAQLAINGDYFLPWWSEGPFDFYPQSGDLADVLGASVSNGALAGWQVVPYTALVFGVDGGVSIVEVRDRGQRLPAARHAVSGKQLVVDGGQKTGEASATPQARVRHPRTAAALDRTGKTLILVLVDGRQPGYSEGATLDELAELILAHGGWRAMNMDGGGSTTLVVDDGEGGARLLNVPIHTRIPWRERTVANHLGVFARPAARP